MSRWLRLCCLAAIVAVLAAVCAPNPWRESQAGASAKVTTAAPKVKPFTVSSVLMWAPTWSYNPWAAGYPTFPLEYLETLPLAVNIPPDPNRYLPILASHWSVSGSKISITLRPRATWQDGSPVTSSDVLTTLLIDGTEGAGGLVWPFVASVATPSSHTLSIQVKAGTSAEDVLDQVLRIFPVPSSQYGPLLGTGTKELEAEILTENQTAGGKPTPAATKAAAALAKIFDRVTKFNPHTPLGNGPFRLVHQTVQEANLTKWNGFYAASKIHVPAIEAINAEQDGSVIGLQAEGGVDYTWEAIPDLSLVKRFLSTTGNKIHAELGISSESFFFDPYKYPYTLRQVRQAIAYAIKLPGLAAAGMGSEPGLSYKSYWPPKAYIDGLNPLNEQKFLSPATKRRLVRYHYDPAKAAKLLESVGFRKVGGKWLLPDGKAFHVPVYLWSGRPTPSGLAITDQLNRFGIASSTEALPNAQVISELTSTGGLAFEFGATDTDPLSSLLSMVDVVPPPKGSGPISTVPGLGKVNVIQALSQEDTAVGVGPQMKRLTDIWARYFNQQADFLTFADYVYPYQYNTTTYGDWPGRSNSLWNVEGHFELIFEFLVHGYLRPRH